MLNKFKGCLLGLACGDAVGTTIEFMPRGSFEPVTDMVGGGPFRLRAGEWTDDTSLALCLAASLIEKQEFDPKDQMERFCRWHNEGYMSSNGTCFDIGTTTSMALNKFLCTGEPFSGSEHSLSAGNGSLMRLAPIPMFYVEDLKAVVHFSGASSKTTHGAPQAVSACQLFGKMLAIALRSGSKEEILSAGDEFVDIESFCPSISDIAEGGYLTKTEDEIEGSGYVVKSLEAALWCFFSTEKFKDAILEAVNLGDDADTTGAICGQIAGAFYGIEGIPTSWLDKLAKRDLIEEMAIQLYNNRPR